MRRSPAAPVALVLAGSAVLAQITYPLLDDEALRLATVVAVLLFCGASLAHAATAGARAALTVLVVCGGLGLAAEAVGVATGLPFGEYTYTGSLGLELVGVPLLVPLAWTMMAWPALVAARRLVPGAAAVPVAAWVLVSWDLFLDPQMVEAGHWVWTNPEPGLPGVEGIPLTNYAGWLLVAVVMQTVLHVTVPRPDDVGGTVDSRDTDDRRDTDGRRDTDDAVPVLLLGWTWLGSTLANAAFFGRPAVAAWGFVAMGVVVAPYLARVVAERRAPQGVEAGQRP